MEAHEFFQPSFCPQFPSDNSSSAAADHFIVEDLFDFSHDDPPPITTDTTATFDDSSILPTDHSPTVTTPVDSTGNSNFLDFSGDLSVPYDDLAELEWLSKFSDESFSSEDMQKLQLISGVKVPNDAASQSRDEPNTVFNPPVSVPAKARSKRSRGPPCNWASRLLVLSPSTTTMTATSSQSDAVTATVLRKSVPRKRDTGDGGEGRKCLHCQTDKTPQWRTGPMGPKTLCNACGVRYKSGRLVPEYRPAASPTFVLTKHSNSHRKVMELRRQKEMARAQQQQLLQLHHQQNMMFDVSSNGDDYLIHQHVGPDFSHMI